MQKVLNYGSFLQAFALKKIIEQRGHDVYFIDIIPGRKIIDVVPQKFNLWSKLDKYFFKRIENYFFSKKMEEIHISDYTNYLNINKRLCEDEIFDLVIIGSDEVFNATADSSWGFTTQLFGNVKNAKKVVTYAASCGQTTYELAKEFDIISDIAKAMQNLDRISVRDYNTFEFVKRISGVEPSINIDPVFLYDFNEFIPEIIIRKPFVLIYAYPNRISDGKEISAITSFARKKNLQVICVGMQQRWCSHNKTATAFELLEYFKKASYIVTDTFHGAALSIKYNKRFGTLIRDSNRNKLGGLLNQFGLADRCINCADDIESIMDTPICYERVNRFIDREKEKSNEYYDQICMME